MTSPIRIQQLDKALDTVYREERIKERLNIRNELWARATGKISNTREQTESSMKLLKFVADSQFTLTQVNGQRKLGPPSEWTGPPPGPKCEIFVGSIPRNFYEPEIVLIFGTVGKIYELRLMMEFSGTNRGYCFIMYTTEEEAARAVRELDQYEVYPGKRIGVVASTNNCRLFIHQLPATMDSETIIRRIYQVTDDIEKVSVYRNVHGFVCYALVCFKTHRGTAMGRRRLVPECATLFNNHEVTVEWANPNMVPSNVFEDCGTCDAQGKVEITKTFIEPTKKSAARHKIFNWRSASMQNQRSQKSFNATVEKCRPIRAATQSLLQKTDNPTNHWKNENHQSRVLAPYNLFPEFANREHLKMAIFSQQREINGNLKNHDNFMLHECFKKNCIRPDLSSAILPSISAYLKKEKRMKTLKWNDEQKCDKNPRKYCGDVRTVENNFSHVLCSFSNNNKLDYSEEFDGHSYPAESRSRHYRFFNFCNPTDRLVERFPEALKITSDDEKYDSYDRANVHKNQQVPLKNTIDQLSNNFSSSNVIDRQTINCPPYANYYQNFPICAVKEDNGSSRSRKHQSPPFGLNGCPKNPAPNSEYFSQRPLNDAKPLMINSNFNWLLRAPLCDIGHSRNKETVPHMLNGVAANGGNRRENDPTTIEESSANALDVSAGKIDDPFSFGCPLNRATHRGGGFL